MSIRSSYSKDILSTAWVVRMPAARDCPGVACNNRFDSANEIDIQEYPHQGSGLSRCPMVGVRAAVPTCEVYAMRTLLIDNYDSFTYNLYQLIGEVCGRPSYPRDPDGRTARATSVSVLGQSPKAGFPRWGSASVIKVSRSCSVEQSVMLRSPCMDAHRRCDTKVLTCSKVFPRRCR